MDSQSYILHTLMSSKNTESQAKTKKNHTFWQHLTSKSYFFFFKIRTLDEIFKAIHIKETKISNKLEEKKERESSPKSWPKTLGPREAPEHAGIPERLREGLRSWARPFIAGSRRTASSRGFLAGKKEHEGMFVNKNNPEPRDSRQITQIPRFMIFSLNPP